MRYNIITLEPSFIKPKAKSFEQIHGWAIFRKEKGEEDKR